MSDPVSDRLGHHPLWLDKLAPIAMTHRPLAALHLFSSLLRHEFGDTFGANLFFSPEQAPYPPQPAAPAIDG